LHHLANLLYSSNWKLKDDGILNQKVAKNFFSAPPICDYCKIIWSNLFSLLKTLVFWKLLHRCLPIDLMFRKEVFLFVLYALYVGCKLMILVICFLIVLLFFLYGIDFKIFFLIIWTYLLLALLLPLKLLVVLLFIWTIFWPLLFPYDDLEDEEFYQILVDH